ADLVLLGDNFSIIPAAIQEGRTIVANIRKVITYLLSGAFTATILVGTSIALGLPLPVTAPQILWVNLLQDGLPAIALTFEKGAKHLMRRKPEGKSAVILTGEMKVIIFVIGILTDLMLLGMFLWLLALDSYSLEHIRTFVFVALGIASTLYVFSIKNMEENIWRYNPFSNPHLVGAAALGFLLLAGAVYLPLLQTLFHTVPLGALDWILLFGFGFVNVLLIELAKWYFVKRESNTP
ncbi:MAG: cation transporting ATPase C-terminal domain-containing protein, partial [Candidatus Yanofskybacteria bacterium]|nr:cation transporting ATPase C-terminal domain-containing protein [Candidatus Yanofskybacteria bacterium]